MNKKIIGVTVGTPTSPSKIEEELKPVKTVNGVEPDENGNVQVSTSQGGNASIDVTAVVGQTIVVKETDENGKPVKWESADYQPPIGYEPAEKSLIVTTEYKPDDVGVVVSHSYDEIYEHIRNGGTVVLDDIDAGILPISCIYANTAYFGKVVTVNTEVGERVVMMQAAVKDKTITYSVVKVPDANNYYNKQELEELFGGAFLEMGEILEGFSETIPTKTSQLENDSTFVTQNDLAVAIPKIAEYAAGLIDTELLNIIGSGVVA